MSDSDISSTADTCGMGDVSTNTQTTANVDTANTSACCPAEKLVDTCGVGDIATNTQTTANVQTANTLACCSGEKLADTCGMGDVAANTQTTANVEMANTSTCCPGEKLVYNNAESAGVNSAQRLYIPYDSDDDSDGPYEDASNYSGGKSCDKEASVVDDADALRREALLTDEEKQKRCVESRTLKDEGNELFGQSSYGEAIDKYTASLVVCLLSDTRQRAILYSNRAACYCKLENVDAAIADCDRALLLWPEYVKALLRRADMFEKKDKLDEALADYTRALELDPSLHQARAATFHLSQRIEARNEKMKAEMMGKLKDLGNMVLRPFGLSTDNFQFQKDPNTGSYSVKFEQQPRPQ